MKPRSSSELRPKRLTHILTKFFIIICILLFIISVITFIGIRASKNLEVNYYSIETDTSSTLRIVQLTDLHNAEFGQNNVDLVKTVKTQCPDIIFMTGDMINRDDKNLDIICVLIKQLSDIAPVYFGYGNHETSWEEYFGQSISPRLTDAGAYIVQDNYVDIDINGQALRIGGCMNYYRKWGMMTSDPEQWNIEDTFANEFENTNRYKILLNHIPTSWVDWGGIDEYNVNLVFSGHYHGGMIRIPIIDCGVYAPYIGLFPKYTKGVTNGTKAICVQSTGLGTEHSIPRIYNPPEVVVVDLIPDAD